MNINNKKRTKKYRKKSNTRKQKQQKGGTNGILEKSEMYNLESHAAAKAISTATGVGHAAITILTATGVGIPVAGALAGALLIASKLAKIYVNNKILFPIMLDSIIILANCYKLHHLIEKSIFICQQRIYQKKAINNEIIKKVKIDEEIKTHILIKIGELTVFLLKTATQEVLNALLKDADIMKSGFAQYVNQENLSRTSRASKLLGSIQRSAKRTFSSTIIKDQITDNLSLINSFFIIMKSQFDFLMQTYKEEFTNDWNSIIVEIEKTNEFKSYMIHEDSKLETIGNEVDEIIQSEEKSMKEASQQAIESENGVNDLLLASSNEENEIVSNEETSEAAALQALSTNKLTMPKPRTKRKIIKRGQV